MQDFHYSSAVQEIIFAVGAFERVGEVIERHGWERLLAATTGSLRRGGQLGTLEQALGGRLVGSYEHVQPHVPDYQVAEVLELARNKKVDAVIGFGGGSSIGMAKAVSFTLSGERAGSNEPQVPAIAIPTTYAGSEMTPVYGVTRHDEEPARKATVSDPGITPRVALYDPLLTLKLPPDMTASTGINALAHCIEALYSITRNPISTAIALHGIEAIGSALPRCYAEGSDLEARTQMLSGSMLAGMALAHVAMGLHHGLCHVLGGSAGVPHGVANSIVLPHAVRFNLDVTAPQLAQAGEALARGRWGEGEVRWAKDGGAAEELVHEIDTLIGELNLPRRLRDARVLEEDLPRLAEIALENRAVQNNPKPISRVEQILDLLRAAW